MARISLDDLFFGSDKRVHRLAALTGEPAYSTRGRLIQVYHDCYSHRTPLRTAAEVDIQAEWIGASPFVELMVHACLAERSGGDEYRIKGVSERIEYLLSQAEKGRRGGEVAARKRVAGAKHLLETAVPPAKPGLSKCSSKLKPLPTATATALPPPLSTNTNTEEEYSVGADGPPTGIRSPVGFFISRYVEAYRVRYGAKARPDLSRKVQGQIKLYVGETPLSRAVAMIETFLDMGDSWFLLKSHDFGTFRENLSKIGVALDTGRTVTRREANAAESADAGAKAIAIVAAKRHGPQGEPNEPPR